MRISFTTLACPEWDWATIVETASKCGYDGIEVRGVQGQFDLTKAAPFLDGNIDATLSDLERRCLVISCLDTSCSFHDPKTLARALSEGKSHIDLAQRLGARFIRVFGDHVPDPGEKAKTMNQISNALRELGIYASTRNVEVLIETHGDFSKSEDILNMVKAADHPNVAVLWDVHHPYRFHGEPMAQSYATLKDYVRVTHLKDSVVQADGNVRYVLTGEGDIPLRECVLMLKDQGPDIWLSLEWEKKWHPEIEEPEKAIPQFIEKVKEYLSAPKV